MKELHNITTHPAIEGTPEPVERLATLAGLVGIHAPSPGMTAEAFIDRIRSIQKDIGEPSTLKEARVPEDRVKEELLAAIC